jgi:hypothetical protein
VVAALLVVFWPAPAVKLETATALKLLMMGVRTAETC